MSAQRDDSAEEYDPATDWTPTPTRRLTEDEERALTNALRSVGR